jgi:capsid protein
MKASLYLATAVLVTSLTAAHADCLDDVTEFGDKICGAVRTIGKSGLVTGNGELNAAAKELIAKALAEYGGKVGAATKTYEEVFQEQLAAERVSLRKCGIALARAAMDQICSKASP